jgi:uncharacterized membrane protein YkvA (DUF1232 family)
MTKIPPKALIALVSALLYGASPIDLLPDILPLIGLVDDALIVPLFLILAVAQFRKVQKKQPVPAQARYIPPRSY